jgi:cellulose synthase operon protein B
MKTLFRIGILFTLLSSLLLTTALPGLAQAELPPTETPEPLPPLESGYLPFWALGKEDIVMRGPFDSADVRFTTPTSWKLEPGAMLSVVLSASFSTSDSFPSGSSIASVNITLNNERVGTVFLSSAEEQVFTLAIPEKALTTSRQDGRHVLEFSLDASIDCDYPHQTTVIVHSSSVLNFPITLVPAATDLSILPRPFYQDDSFLPETSLLIIPDSPSDIELQSALTVSAAFGRMSSGRMDLQLLPVSELSDELRASSHLIFVGDDASLSDLLALVTFPDAQAQIGDGILQTAISPWNESRAVLHVSGVDNDGLIKAAQALTYGVIQPGADLQSAVIREVNPDLLAPFVATSRTFAELGYLSRNVEGIGVSTLEYRFYIPPGYVPGTNPHLNLIYTHSAFLDFGISGVIVLLNDQRLSSIQFSEETAAQMNSVKIPLYADFLLPGDNRLNLQVELRPANLCSTISARGSWFITHDTSLVHVPLSPASARDSNQGINLTKYPYPFTSTPSLDDVGFVLSQEDAASWKVASQLAAELGRRATGQILAPQVSFAGQLAPGFDQNHLILVGLPANLPILAELADVMPAPFEPGSNMVIERTLAVTYRLAEGVSLGYIELFTSPWNSQKAVLAVLGSTPEGLAWAFDAMTIPTLRGRLMGDYVVVNRTQLLATDTRVSRTTSGLAASLVEQDDEVLVTLPTPQIPVGEPISSATPDWILPTVAVVSALTVMLILFVIATSFKKRQ